MRKKKRKEKETGQEGFTGGLYYQGNLVIQPSKIRSETWFECIHCGKITKAITPEWQKKHIENIIHSLIWKIKKLFGIRTHKIIDWYGKR